MIPQKKSSQKKTSSKTINARRAGHQYERDLVKELKELLKDEEISTSRYSSRKLDDAKVDIFGTQKYGFHIQAKRYKNNPNLFEVLSEMPTDECINTIFWKKPHVGEIVCMTKQDFYELLIILINEGK
jgi:AmiR/NasT family two-component response regulator